MSHPKVLGGRAASNCRLTIVDLPTIYVCYSLPTLTIPGDKTIVFVPSADSAIGQGDEVASSYFIQN